MAGATPRDTALLMGQIDAIRIEPPMPHTQSQAALVVCDRATDMDDAAELLRALGLADPAHTRVWRKQDSVLGHHQPEVAV